MSGFNIEMLNSVSGSGPSLTRAVERAAEGRTSGPESKAPGTGNATFAELLNDKLSEANRLVHEADSAAEELISGRTKDLHGTMIALEKADVSFRMLMQVRNKMIEAYREIMRMQV